MKLDVARTHSPWPGIVLRSGDYFGDVPDALGDALVRRNWMKPHMEPEKKKGKKE